MQHAGGASRAGMLRCRSAGTLLAFGDQSATLANCGVAVAAIVRSRVLGVSNSVQPHLLPWLAYFGLDGAHDLI